MTVTTVGVLMAGIDSRIVIVGLPQVASSLRADAEQAIWITQAYVLGSTVALLLVGRISDIVGRVKLYTSGFAVFTLGSLLTSLALDPAQVIAFRAIQGLGSAILFTNSAAMIVDATPSQELGLSLGINQVAFRMGSMAGLTLSGIILSFLDWRALFYVNVPIGIFGTAWARLRLREVGKLERGAPIDWGGFAAFTVFIMGLLLALTLAAYGVAETRTVAALFAVSLVSLGLFVVLERRHPHPLLDLKLLRIREFTGGVVAQLLNAIAFGAVLLLLSLYFQLVLKQSPLTTGLLVISLSLFLFSTTDAATPYSHLVVYMVLFGAGLGFFASPNISSIMGSVPPERRGIASGFRATFFNVGYTISLNLAILITTFTLPYMLVTHRAVHARHANHLVREHRLDLGHGSDALRARDQDDVPMARGHQHARNPAVLAPGPAIEPGRQPIHRRRGPLGATSPDARRRQPNDYYGRGRFRLACGGR